MDTNPYSAPLSELEGVPIASPEDLEADRRAHINVERNLKQLGALYLLGGVVTCLAFVLFAFVVAGMVLGEGQDSENLLLMVGALGVYAVIGPANIWVGLGLRRRNPSVRIVASIFAGLSLLSFPLGTLFGGFLLWLMWSTKGKRVFAPDYQAVIDATPHVVMKTSPIVWGFLLLLVLLVGAGILAAVVS